MNLIIESERLIYRPFELSDAEALFNMDKNPNVHKYLWQKPTLHIEESIEIIEYLQKQYRENGIGRFATILKETGEFIGWTGIKFINDHVENGNTNFYDYGYRLNENFWNQGFATEATKAWLAYGFNQMNIKLMNAYTHAENGASNHILSKSGFQFVEDYPDKDGVTWKWWQLENNSVK
ncbi:MAG TPA: GNAT family N-acetyltransferase [Flavobacterium sp.]|uniref:GNAT family N-acetyltransferase n=1 Tax=Flavobacterium sp. TaxID=239 RepID=UPI002B4AEF16|nr:GNAT family N-acetyltransferase [Flavobacterium sp.]HLO72679.1 GNAT family N-acetyltransferase [Flavobacterium sp.]